MEMFPSENDLTTASVLQVIKIMHMAKDAQTLNVATGWLAKFQKTKSAWEISHAFLTSPEVGFEAQQFAATTLRNKLKNDFYELSPQQVTSLRDSMVEILKRSTSARPSVITTLCAGLAVHAIQMHSLTDSNNVSLWADPVKDLMDLFSSSPEFYLILLNLMTVFPEECNLERVTINEDVANAFFHIFAGNADRVLEMLTFYFQNSAGNLALQEAIFKCLLSWLKTDYISTKTLAVNPLLQISFEALAVPQLFDVAVDVVCEIIHGTRRISESMDVIRIVYGHLSNLLSTFRTIRGNEDAEEQFRGFCRIFCMAGESYVPLVIENESFGAIVQGILECTAFNDVDVASMTFYFWGILCDHLCGDGDFLPFKDRFVPYYNQLVRVIINHLRLPEDDATVSAEKRDQFRDFRHRIGDTLKDCTKMLGSSASLAHILELLKSLVVDNPSRGIATPWTHVEAVLCALRSMCRGIDIHESVLMPQILQLWGALPEHRLVRFMATLVLGRYAEWLNAHPEHLGGILPYIVAGFKVPECEPASAQSLCDIFFYCNTHLTGHTEEMFNLCASISGTLSKPDADMLKKALARLIRPLPIEQMESYLLRLCQPEVEAIKRELTFPSADAVKVLKVHVLAVHLALKEVDFAEKDAQTHPYVRLIVEIWPLCRRMLIQYRQSVPLVESVCKLMFTWLRSCPRHILDLIPSIVEGIIEGFRQQSSTPTFLYLGRQLVCTYYKDIQLLPHLSVLERDLSTTSLQFLSQQDNLLNFPDVVEDFFMLQEEVIFQHPKLLLDHGLLQPTIELFLAVATRMREDQVQEKGYRFMESLVLVVGSVERPNSRHDQAVTRALQQILAPLVEPIITAIIVGFSTVYSLHLVAPISHFLVSLSSSKMCDVPAFLLKGTIPLSQEVFDSQRLLRNLSEAIKANDIRRVERCLAEFAYCIQKIPRSREN